jgi:hypothetical protein
MDGDCYGRRMSVQVASRADVSLDALRRVAREGEAVEVSPAALAHLDRFLAQGERGRPLPGRGARCAGRARRPGAARPCQAAPPALAALVEDVRAMLPPVEQVRSLGPDADALVAAFGRRVFAGRVAADSVARAIASSTISTP